MAATTFPYSSANPISLLAATHHSSWGSSSTPQNAFSSSQIIELASGSHVIIENRLGSGTYGQVYAVRHMQSGRPYAMKVIPIKSEMNLRWARSEVQVLEKIRDSGAHQFGLTLLKNLSIRTGQFCLFMDKMDGDLWGRMRAMEGRPFQLSEIRHIGSQLFTALGKLHSLGLIHADIKPENILIAQGHQPMFSVQISDFGCSVPTNIFRDRRGDTLQSLFYRAPEVLFGMHITQKIDVWSVGCILAELFVSHIFYPAVDEIQLAYFISTTQGIPANLSQSLYWNKYFHLVRNLKMDSCLPVFLPKYPHVRLGIPDRRHRAYSGLNSILYCGYSARFLGYATPFDLQFVRDLHLLMNVDSDFRCTADEAKNLSFFQI